MSVAPKPGPWDDVLRKLADATPDEPMEEVRDRLTRTSAIEAETDRHRRACQRWVAAAWLVFFLVTLGCSVAYGQWGIVTHVLVAVSAGLAGFGFAKATR